ncbi:MAG: histidinol dehydrogenase [Prevotella sp.]|nr:histidinol dehydrogenase [Prevotella sp.]
MNYIKYPRPEDYERLTERPKLNAQELHQTVSTILADVKTNGDKAVIAYERKFDHADLEDLAVTADEMEEADKHVAENLKAAIELAHENIYTFHKAQQSECPRIHVRQGIECWQKAVPIERVGLYIPGGTAPLFSTVLMLATPAKIAGCKEIVLCTPPDKEGKINPAVLVAAQVAGVRKIYKAGGVQAIAAMAYGTETVPKVYKIFGPGNQYVTAAKQLVSLDGTAIDMPAGPSEVCVIADDTSNTQFVAADLLSQAEHGKDSQVVLITDSEQKLTEVLEEIERQLRLLPRWEIATQALNNSKAILVRNTQEAMDISNIYSPEHLIIATKDYAELADRVVNAGSVFLGDYACESAGDYASGTNHTLPTNGNARAYSGICLDSFMKKVTFQHLTSEGIGVIGSAVELMAENEQLHAHKNAMTVRVKEVKKLRN